MVFVGQGDQQTEAIQLELRYAPPAKADFAAAAQLMASWQPDYRGHLLYLARFLNHDLLPEVRWHNGYRVLEWHFRRGKVGLAKDLAYRAFLDEHGAALDVYLASGQSRAGLLEQTRDIVAHAILAKNADPLRDGKTNDLVLGTFAALESLVIKVMNEATTDGCFFTHARRHHWRLSFLHLDSALVW